MQTVPLIASWREGAIIAGAVLAVILFLWFLARLSHRPYLVFGQSEAMQASIAQVGRLADAIERLAQLVENRPRLDERQADMPAEAEERHRAMGLSMFGR